MRYFTQRSVIDDAGSLIAIGIDENLRFINASGVKLRPSVAEQLIRCVEYHGYTPILRYRSFPYATDYMLPILDTPMSCNGWADLYIDTRGKSTLFIAKDQTTAGWHEMMRRLQQLFQQTVAQSGYHFLAITRNSALLHAYMAAKYSILADYYLIHGRDPLR